MAVTPDAGLAQAAAWHRQVAAMVEAADRVGVAIDELPTLRARLTAQAIEFSQAAARLGVALPALVPTPSEVATAGANLGDLSAPAVAAAMRTMAGTLDAVDSAIGQGTAPAPPVPTARLAGSSAPAPDFEAVPTPPRHRLRHAAVYGAYAFVVLVVQVVLFLVLDETSGLPLFAPLCLFVFPALAWGAGYLSIAALNPTGPDEQPDRSPKLGIVVCLIPNLLLCGIFGVSFIASRFG